MSPEDRAQLSAISDSLYDYGILSTKEKERIMISLINTSKMLSNAQRTWSDNIYGSAADAIRKLLPTDHPLHPQQCPNPPYIPSHVEIRSWEDIHIRMLASSGFSFEPNLT